MQPAVLRRRCGQARGNVDDDVTRTTVHPRGRREKQESKRVAHSKAVYSNNAEYHYRGALVRGNIADPICG